MSPFKPPTLLADLPGRREFDYCIKITNLDKYPEYLVFVNINSENSLNSPSQYRNYELIRSGDCFPVKGYYPVAEIAAISKAKVKPNDLMSFNEEKTILQNPDLEKKLIQGSPKIKAHSLPSFYQDKHVEDSFQIQSISPNGLQLTLVN